MANVRIWLVMALLFGMIVVGCNNGTTDNVDTWSKITNASQLNGIWKVLSNIPSMTIKEWFVYEDGKDSESFINTSDQQMVTLINSLNVTTTDAGLVTFTNNGKTALITGTGTYVFSGGNINNAAVWNYFTQNFLDSYAAYDGYTINYSNKSMTRPYNYSTTLDDDEFNEVLSLTQINQNGTKLKLPPEVLQLYGDPATAEIAIAVRQ